MVLSKQVNCQRLVYCMNTEDREVNQPAPPGSKSRSSSNLLVEEVRQTCQSGVAWLSTMHRRIGLS